MKRSAPSVTRIAWLMSLSLLALPLQAAETPAAGREKLSLDRGWRFHRGDIPFPVISGHGMSYANAKAGKAWGAADPSFDVSGWSLVNLPHDWAVESPFDPAGNLAQGYRPRGMGWYQRQFKLDATDRGRHLEVQIDGAVTHCRVWFNGTLVHRNWCGYTSFYIDITSMAQYGDAVNTLTIQVDADAQEGWWYEGAGLYRHTWLVKRNPVHLTTDGLWANPVKAADGTWSLPVQATLENSGLQPAQVDMEVTLTDTTGRLVAQGHLPVKIDPLEKTAAALSLPVAEPKLWSLTSPTLYRVSTQLVAGNQILDAVQSDCGFRTSRFDAQKGYFLNDQPLKIQGVCEHIGHAGVGVAVPDSLWEFRLRKLKEMGVNAYRCAHNPPSTEFLALCDKMGMLVMDENRNFNVTPEYLGQLEWMVRRDRNHPSVILWSVFNEETMQGTEQGYEMVRRLVAAVKRLDTTRPVTAAQSGGQLNPVNVAQAVDVVGFNYQQKSYDAFHAKYPNLPLTSSEDTSAFMTRGEFETDPKKNQIGGYDDQRAPWGATHRAAWKAIAERPFIAGGFIWTGFDYRGEPTPHSWPSAGSFFGCMDLCGFPKAAFYMHQAHWIKDRPILELIPHWNWPEGTTRQVMAISNAPSVKLLLNGKDLGTLPVDKVDFASWQVPYAPGKLEAVALDGTREIARTLVETTGEPASLRLVPDRASLAGDGADAMPVTLEVLDDQGRRVPTAKLMVDLELTGPGAILGLGNGDPNCHEPEKGNRHSVFNGLAQVILQSQPGATGELLLTARASGLKAGQVALKLQPQAAPAGVPVPPLMTNLLHWQMSPASPKSPELGDISDNDMNSWTAVDAGRGQQLRGGRFVILRTQFLPANEVQAKGGTLVFKNFLGKAQVWQGKTLLGSKDSPQGQTFKVALPAGAGQRVIQVVVEATPGQLAGLGGMASVVSPE